MNYYRDTMMGLAALRHYFLSGLMFILITCLLEPVYASNESQEAARLYEEALVQFRQQETGTAIIHLKNAIQKDPNFLSAHVLLGKAHLRNGDPASAEKELLVAESRGADKTLILVPLGQAYLGQNKFERLIEKIQPGPFPREVNAEILVLRGQAFLKMGNVEEADLAFVRALDYMPRFTSAVLGRATVLLRRGELAAADQVVSDMLKTNDKDPETWFMQGSINHATGRLSDALASYDKAISFEPRHLEARISRAGLFIDSEKHQEALKDLNYLREEYPYDARIPYLQAVTHSRTGDIERSRSALQDASTIIDEIPEEALERSGPTLLLAGLINYSLAQWEKALSNLESYVRAYPNQAGAQKLLASLLLSRGKNEQALALLERAYEIAPNDYKLLTMLGTEYMRRGRHLAAAELLDRAVSLDPYGTDARTKRALNRLASGDRTLAVEELVTVFEQQTDRRQAGIMLAMLHLKNRRYKEATRILQILYDDQPDNYAVLNFLASAQFSAQEYKKARANYEQVIRETPDHIPARINLAKLDLVEGNTENARQRLLDLLEDYPEHAVAMYELARIEERRGNSSSAIRLLKKAQGIDQDDLNVAVYLAELLLTTGKPEEALKIAQGTETIARDDLRVLGVLGKAYLANGDAKTASIVFKNMSKTAGYDSKDLFDIARLQHAAGDAESAIWSIQKALDSSPDFFKAEVTLVELQLNAGRTSQAFDSAAGMIKKYPDRSDGYRLLGEAYLAQKRFEKSIDQFRQAVALEQSAKLTLRLAQAYMASGDFGQSLRVLQKWVESHPEDVAMTYALAENFLRLGKIGDAARVYERVLEDIPEHPLVLNNLANIYQKSGDSRAIEYARRAYEQAPDNPMVNDTLGWLLVRNQQAVEGLTYLRSAHSRAAGNPEIRYHIAVALSQMGRDAEARTELENALKHDRDFDGKEEARGLLKRLSLTEHREAE